MKLKFSSVIILGALFLGIHAYAQNNNKPINQLQVIGSHNSYKNAIPSKLFDYLVKKDTTGGIYHLQYEHIPMMAQLDMGLRNLEMDAYADVKGGLYAHPKGLELVKDQPPYDPDGKMNQPGFKMLHVLDIDFRGQYYLLSEGLTDLKKWSEAHPKHEPIFITLEPKDGNANEFGTQPESYTPEIFDKLDTALLDYLGRERIITPDDIKGHYNTLEEAVLHQNWPTLGQARGKFLFILDTKGKKKKMYAKNHPSLKGRTLFINAEEGTPEAAVMIINNPKDDRIPKLVKKGYLIRTRADANTKEARTNDYSRFEAAKKSGAQIITTDYYLPSQLFNSDYHIYFYDGRFIRDNPINGDRTSRNK